MGSSSSKKKAHRIVFLGLDNAGKSVLVRRLVKEPNFADVTPNCASSVYKTKFRGCSFSLWDVPGNEKLRPLWNHQLNNLSLLCFVIDLSDEARFAEAMNELSKINENHELKTVPFLIIANKSDLPTEELSIEILRAKFSIERPPNSTSSLVDFVTVSATLDFNLNPVLESMFSLITGVTKRQTKGETSHSRPTSKNTKSIVRESDEELGEHVVPNEKEIGEEPENILEKEVVKETRKTSEKEETEKQVKEETEMQVKEETEMQVKEETEIQVKEETEMQVKEETEKKISKVKEEEKIAETMSEKEDEGKESEERGPEVVDAKSVDQKPAVDTTTTV